MYDCFYCKAKGMCSAAAEPGSVMCMINRMRYGGTHADEEQVRQPVLFCQYCGHRLQENGKERFCNNTYCLNCYKSV